MDLDSSITSLAGVGAKTAEILEKAGIKTVGDLFYYFPRDYEDYGKTTKIGNLVPGKVLIKAKIENLKTKYARRNFSITEGEAYDETGRVRVVWFNQPYRTKGFKEDAEYYFKGSYDYKYGRYQITSPSTVAASDIAELESINSNGFQPIYGAKGKLNSLWFKRLFDKHRVEIAEVPDLLPAEPFQAGTRADALFNIHFPSNEKDVSGARDYLAYEELFELILAAKLNKIEANKIHAKELPFVLENTKKLIATLPFKLTNAQRLATWDILQDMEKNLPMNRLLQGDVGSGKTIVAAIAAYQAVMAGAQVAILAPTAILASQHLETFRKVLEPLGVKCALLVSATKKKVELKKKIADGEIDVVVGTHALLTDDTEFKNLGLCVIDEQHRFGVMQRQKLLTKTKPLSPHLLSMTATPIPRSLQLTVFGDLTVSTINELPKNRQKIKTHILSEVNMKDSLYPKIREHIKAEEQVYWICPLVEETGRSEATDVKKQTKRLKEIFRGARIDFLHGKMKPDEKDEKMAKFASGKLDILVSTTVVEVGVDVPNATQIVVMDAENFGLAQLHQLRGRVGRGTKPSTCYFITKGGEAPSVRLKELEKSTDGFHLAEVDLRLRGPGEIYGKLQHGAMNLRIATLADTKLISLAQKYADEFVKYPENLANYPELAQKILKYQKLTTLN